MIDLKTGKGLKFNSPKELLDFMDNITDEYEYLAYTKQYHNKFKTHKIEKQNGKSNFVKVEKIIKSIEDIEVVKIVKEFVFYSSILFDGLIKIDINKNVNFLSNLNETKIDQDMWNKMRCDL